MAERITIDIEILKGIFGELNALKKQFGEITGSVKAIEDTSGKSFNALDTGVKDVNTGVTKLNNQLEKTRAIDIAAIAGSFQAIGNRMNESAESGIRFQSSMADLSAITGLAGKELDDIGGMARKLTLELGGDASDSVNTYKLLLSQLSPELGKQPALLNEMARNAILLGKTMGGDTAGATEVLTTVLNQFGVDMKDPANATKEMSRIMNVMAAAAKEGSAELPALKDAMMQAGGTAMRAGLNYEETAAALEVLDKAGLKASSGGMALRNTLSILAQGRFLPPQTQEELRLAGVDVNALGDKSKTLKERLELLKPVANDTALMVKFFGRENAQGAQALIGNTELLGEYTEKITGTSTATDQAATVMGTYAEKMSRWKAQFNDFGISLFNATKGFLPFMNVGFSSVGMMADLANANKGLAMVMNTRLLSALSAGVASLGSMTVAQALSATWSGIVSGATAIWTGAQWLLNAALTANPIGVVVVAVAALVGGIIYAFNHFESFRAVVMGVWEVLKQTFAWVSAFVRPLIDVIVVGFRLWWAHMVRTWDTFKSGIRQIGEWLGQLWEWVSGFKDKVVGAFSGLVDVLLAPFRVALEALSAIPGMDKLLGKVKVVGEKVGKAFSDGREKGAAAFRAGVATPTAAATGTTNAMAVTPGTDMGAGALLGGAPTTEPGAVGGIAGKGGSGGGDRNISMNITIANTFGIGRNSDTDAKGAAEKIVGALVNKLRDAELAIG